MSDEPIEEDGECGAGNEPLTMIDGEVFIWNPAALLDEYQADAIRFSDGELWVLKEKSRMWVRVDRIKPTAAGKVRDMKGQPDGAK